MILIEKVGQNLQVNKDRQEVDAIPEPTDYEHKVTACHAALNATGQNTKHANSVNAKITL